MSTVDVKIPVRLTQTERQSHATFLPLPGKYISSQNAPFHPLPLTLLPSSVIFLVRKQQDGRNVDQGSSGDVLLCEYAASFAFG